ncbi:hypothetical protein EJ08DRAFT_653258 [Tothia fuscella]|uniref:Uncharacterized protein n=1 Tax=Tothia fuscella TaxID=1048955 RepID=A0A9P4NI75_9PEZI|nr:hypothetical protein EJ08DRAFT_653258 [Tothia fuscella]
MAGCLGHVLLTISLLPFLFLIRTLNFLFPVPHSHSLFLKDSPIPRLKMPRQAGVVKHKYSLKNATAGEYCGFFLSG